MVYRAWLLIWDIRLAELALGARPEAHKGAMQLGSDAGEAVDMDPFLLQGMAAGVYTAGVAEDMPERQLAEQPVHLEEMAL
jgi:hypothetical protein